MRRVEDKSTPTPLPVVVDVGAIPAARDSARGFAVEVSKAEPETTESARQVHRSRRLVKALIIPTIAAVSLLVPNVIREVDDKYHNEAKAAMAKVEAKELPLSLQHAQATAAQRLFGFKGMVIDVDAAQEIASHPSNAKRLNVSSYVNTDQVEVTEDGKFFTVDGQKLALVRTSTEKGGVYILAGRSFVAEGENHLADALMVGGAHNDGTSTPEEIREKADQSAREILGGALQKPVKYSKNTTEESE